ncbi:hypothetical protein BS78_07G123500 [Paspalum vaginatum]|nr:hypothetical protein BS78_07G123500 [Paspalum vaginatum]
MGRRTRHQRRRGGVRPAGGRWTAGVGSAHHGGRRRHRTRGRRRRIRSRCRWTHGRGSPRDGGGSTAATRPPPPLPPPPLLRDDLVLLEGCSRTASLRRRWIRGRLKTSTTTTSHRWSKTSSSSSTPRTVLWMRSTTTAYQFAFMTEYFFFEQTLMAE